MKFHKYNDIENLSRKKFIDQLVLRGLYKGTWVVQEKVHGSNFSFWLTKENGCMQIKCAKRTGFLAPDDNFFNFQHVLKKYQRSLVGMFNAIKPKEHMAVFGELFGGYYPEKGSSEGTVRVQKGICYNPENDFYAFDLCVDGRLLSVHAAEEYFMNHGLFYAETIYEGTFDKVIKHTNKFISKISAHYRLPPVKDNFCEGVVLKPREPMFLPTGQRVMLKNKNDKWAENKSREAKVETGIPKEMQHVLDRMLLGVTENRLRNVISKFGPVETKDFGHLVGLMNKDVLAEFDKDNGGAALFDALAKDKQKRITKILNTQASLLIRKNFINIIDGEF